MELKDHQVSLCVEKYGPSRLQTMFLPEHWYVFKADRRDANRAEWIIANLKGPWFYCTTKTEIIYGFENREDYMKFAICYER